MVLVRLRHGSAMVPSASAVCAPEPMLDHIVGSAGLKRWFAIFFIERGSYSITSKAIADLAPDIRLQYMEFAEPCSDRRREERIERRYSLPGKELRVYVRRRIEAMLADGKAEELYDKGYVTSRTTWKDQDFRAAAIRKFVEVLGKDPKKITADDFNENALGGLLNACKASPYIALAEAGYAYPLEEVKAHARIGFQTDKLYPWELSACPRGLWPDKETRVVAVKWLVWKSDKSPKKIIGSDFTDHGLDGLLYSHHDSPYLALLEAGYVYSLDEATAHARTGFQTDRLYPWELAMGLRGLWQAPKNRAVAVKWLVWKTGKGPRGLNQDDFNENDLGGLLGYYGASPYFALADVGYAYPLEKMRAHAKTGFKKGKLYPWELKVAPQGFWQDQENRVTAVKWLVWKTRKSLSEVTKDMFDENGLNGLIDYGGNSVHATFVEAGYVYSVDEVKAHARAGFQTDRLYPWELKTAPHDFWQDKGNRRIAMDWLVWRISKEPRDISYTDFVRNSLSGLLVRYDNSPYNAFLDVGLLTPTDKAYQRHFGPRGTTTASL